jgi:hypothetical protein
MRLGQRVCVLISAWWVGVCRRAKRLRKLSRMMTSRLAQTATEAFREHTWGVLALLVVAHVACFAVLVIQVTSRYQNAYSVQLLAQGTDKSLMSVIRWAVMRLGPLLRHAVLAPHSRVHWPCGCLRLPAGPTSCRSASCRGWRH